MLRQQLIVALATITAREASYYADEMAEGTISRTAGWLLLSRTNELLDALRDGSVQPYRKVARTEIGRDCVMQIAGLPPPPAAAQPAAGATHGAADRAAPDPAPRAGGPDRLHPQPHPRPVRRAGQRGGAARHRGADRGHRPRAGRDPPAISRPTGGSYRAASSAAPPSASSSRPTTAWPPRACSRPSCCATWSASCARGWNRSRPSRRSTSASTSTS